MEGVIFWLTERNNFSMRPSYAVFGGHFIPRVTGQFKRTPRGMTLLIILLVIGLGLPLLALGCAVALSQSLTR